MELIILALLRTGSNFRMSMAKVCTYNFSSSLCLSFIRPVGLKELEADAVAKGKPAIEATKAFYR